MVWVFGDALNIFTDNKRTATATVINADGDWTATIPVDGLNINKHSGLLGEAIDMAGNTGDNVIESPIFPHAIVRPIVKKFNFNIPDDDDSYEIIDHIIPNKTDGEVVIIATISEVVNQGSVIVVTLNVLNTGHYVKVNLIALEKGTILTGFYTIAEGDVSQGALTIESFELAAYSVTESTLDYEMTSTDLPTGHNIHDHKTLFINAADTTAPTLLSVDTVLADKITWTNMEHTSVMRYNEIRNDLTYRDYEIEYGISHREYYWGSGAISQREISGDFSVSVTLLKSNNYNEQRSIFGISKDKDTTEYYPDPEDSYGYDGTEPEIKRQADISYGMQTFRSLMNKKWYVILYADARGDSPHIDKPVKQKGLFEEEDNTAANDSGHFPDVKEVNPGDIFTIQKKGDNIIYLINNEEVHRVVHAGIEDNTYHIDTTMKMSDTRILAVIENNKEKLVSSSTTNISHVYTFSEKVIGLTIDDFIITNGDIASVDAINPDVNGFASKWKVNITPDTDAIGDVTLILKADAVTDQAGRGNVEDDTQVIGIDKFFITDINTETESSANYLRISYNNDIDVLSSLPLDVDSYEVIVNGESSSRSVVQVLWGKEVSLGNENEIYTVWWRYYNNNRYLFY